MGIVALVASHTVLLAVKTLTGDPTTTAKVFANALSNDIKSKIENAAPQGANLISGAISSAQALTIHMPENPAKISKMMYKTACRKVDASLEDSRKVKEIRAALSAAMAAKRSKAQGRYLKASCENLNIQCKNNELPVLKAISETRNAAGTQRATSTYPPVQAMKSSNTYAMAICSRNISIPPNLDNAFAVTHSTIITATWSDIHGVELLYNDVTAFPNSELTGSGVIR